MCIQVVVIVIEHPDVYCQRLEKVFDKLRVAGARPKETPRGQLFVTNLSLFASSLNIVLVPQDGDFDLYQRRFYLNLNLRRMGCSGRSALTSKSPSDAQREKFNQLYKIQDSGDFEETVIRLVEMVQNCLYIFGLFKLADVDGLLCNATEMGLDEFYTTFLSTKFQRPLNHENMLDPNVLAGMFSKVSNIRGKLQHLINNVPKDPFAEPVAFINAVKAYQTKKPDLKARFLDSKTVDSINAAYQSSFNPQGLKVHKVLKSKIEDFSGMTVVNPEGETTDLEVFAKHIHADSLKQVWKGKPKHRPDMADALASGDWLTGGKELGKSLVRGLTKTTRDTKNASQSLKSMAAGKNRQSLLLSKGKTAPFLNLKEGGMTDDTLVTSAQPDLYSPKSDNERMDGCESDEGTQITNVAVAHQLSEDDQALTTAAGTGATSTSNDPTTAPSNPSPPQVEILTSLFSTLPEEPGLPEIVAFNLEKRRNYMSTSQMTLPVLSFSSIPLSSRKRSQSMTGLVGHERLLGCRIEAAANTGAIPGIHKMESEFSSQLQSLKAILEERGRQFEEIEHEAGAILTERRELLVEVRDKEHATQRSVYHLEGMVGKLVEMRDFTGAFFNKISYLDTKLPVSQRRLALWMDKLQALQSQWFRTIGRYMTAYAPPAVRSRFVEWERDVQLAALKARELRGEVGNIQLGTSVGPTSTTPGIRSPVEEPKTLPIGSSLTTGLSDTLRREEPTHPELRQRGNGGYIDHGLGS
ncbi:hypothetical protein BG006_009544 [Podila minutissima]|uniref:STB6-like N-terminal domain-containing protein n=1 Tax=Podila minutissima TaxID=64525 RepID=A0A9P5VRP2_9FUNG|nr:hypothetical protein BG006_009544 [Podila minutissima]